MAVLARACFIGRVVKTPLRAFSANCQKEKLLHLKVPLLPTVAPDHAPYRGYKAFSGICRLALRFDMSARPDGFQHR